MSEKHQLQDHEIEILVDFAKKIVDNSVEIDPEIAEAMNGDDFWDMDFEILDKDGHD